MPEQIHRLFFALCPDELAAEQIGRAAASIRGDGSLRGRWVKTSRYHMTVQFLGTHHGRPERIIERARAAAALVARAPFEIALDRADTFGGHRRSPCVLRCTPDADAAVRMLHSALGSALTGAGLERLLEARFTPHVTIAYVDRKLAEPIAIAPIRWQARDFSLVASHGPESSREMLDRWALGAGPPA